MMPLQTVTVAPAYKPLGFSIGVPADFRRVPIPAEQHDFSNPATMMSLAMFMASYGVVLCSIAVRPMSMGPEKGRTVGQGSVMEWIMFLSRQQAGSTVEHLAPESKWGTTVVTCHAVQPSDAGEMTVRALFLEDGGNLFNIATMAPAAIWTSVGPTLEAMVDSFVLTAVQGPTRPISPGESPPARAVFLPPRSA